MSQKDWIKAIQTTDESLFNELAEGKEPSLEAASFKGIQIGPMRLHTVDATNTEWEACIFEGTEFDGLDLQGAFFNGCSFHGCTFNNTILAEVSFDGCVIHKTKFLEPEDLEAAEFKNCQFKDCELKNLNCLDTIFESVSISNGSMSDIDGIAELKSVTLRSVNVENFNTEEMTLSKCSCSGCSSVPKGFTVSEGKRLRV